MERLNVLAVVAHKNTTEKNRKIVISDRRTFNTGGIMDYKELAQKLKDMGTDMAKAEYVKCSRSRVEMLIDAADAIEELTEQYDNVAQLNDHQHYSGAYVKSMVVLVRVAENGGTNPL